VALPSELNGLLVIDKPEGPTSHDVVSRMRRATGVTRIGHTGTLDPFASGVLPLVLGRATRLVQFLIGADKAYDAHVRLGLETDTYDITGRPVDPRGRRQPPGPIARERVEEVLKDFRGPLLQQPPPYSAKKINGTRAYVLARRGAAVNPPPSRVFVRELTMVELQSDLVTLHVICSSGFYVRSLAYEIGLRLETGACLQALRRTRSGEFRLDRATPLEHIERDSTDVRELLIPMSELLPGLPSAILTGDGARRAARGNVVGPPEMVRSAPMDAVRVRLLNEEGQLVAIARPCGPQGLLHPDVVVG
jgi:tRNA pseudouridine55 synthase